MQKQGYTKEELFFRPISAGLQHIKQLAASIQAEVSIESKTGEGTMVFVRVKK